MDFMLLQFKLHALSVSDWTVVVAGISIVLGTLMLLIFIFKLFGRIMESTGKKKIKAKANGGKSAESTPAVKPAPVAPPTVPVPVAEQGISGEVVAAISAAVYMAEGSDSVVTSIKTVRKQSPITGRNPWAQAAVIDNTRPF